MIEVKSTSDSAYDWDIFFTCGRRVIFGFIAVSSIAYVTGYWEGNNQISPMHRVEVGEGPRLSEAVRIEDTLQGRNRALAQQNSSPTLVP